VSGETTTATTGTASRTIEEQLRAAADLLESGEGIGDLYVVLMNTTKSIHLLLNLGYVSHIGMCDALMNKPCTCGLRELLHNEARPQDAKVAEGLDERRARLIASAPTLLDALERSREELRRAAANIIAVEGSTDTPYPDDPRWSPWSRFLERALAAIGRADESARQAISTSRPTEGNE
jgi:hypothetical protein